MSAHVKPPKSGRPSREVKSTAKRDKKSQGIKRYAVDIVFPTGHTRCAGTFMHGKPAIKKWRALLSQCTIADTVRISSRHYPGASVTRRGALGHC